MNDSSLSPYVLLRTGSKLGNLFDPILAPVEDATIGTFTYLFPSTSESVSVFLRENKSPHAEKLPLMDPFHVALITIGYLVLVQVGKRLMENRESFKMKRFSIIHNFTMVTLSTYMCGMVLSEAWKQGYSLFANPSDNTSNGWQMAMNVWVFYISKIFEFTDTFIMVMKKNNRQITFLHLYHHSSIFVIWWFVTYVAPNGESYFSAALNSAVHVVMYGYYLSTALSVPIRFIKRYITLFQMTQFVMMMVQATYDIVYFQWLNPNAERKYPFNLTALLWVYMWTMLGLFANFFVADRKRERQAKMAKSKNQ